MLLEFIEIVGIHTKQLISIDLDSYYTELTILNGSGKAPSIWNQLKRLTHNYNEINGKLFYSDNIDDIILKYISIVGYVMDYIS